MAGYRMIHVIAGAAVTTVLTFSTPKTILPLIVAEMLSSLSFRHCFFYTHWNENSESRFGCLFSIEAKKLFKKQNK
jgi:hypothetical protein